MNFKPFKRKLKNFDSKIVNYNGLDFVIRNNYNNSDRAHKRIINDYRFHLIGRDLDESPIGLHIGVLDILEEIVIELNNDYGLIEIKHLSYANFNDGEPAILRWPEHSYLKDSLIMENWKSVEYSYKSGFYNDKEYGHGSNQLNCESVAEFITTGKAVKPQVGSYGELIPALSRSSRSSRSSG